MKPNLIKATDGGRVGQSRPEFGHRMAHSRVVLLASVLLLLTIVHAQEYFLEKSAREANVRARRDAAEFGLGGEPWKSERYRRDDERARYRRQGGHGGGAGEGGGGGHEGITGPVHTFVKTDEHAHFKWGVRHNVGHEYAGRR